MPQTLRVAAFQQRSRVNGPGLRSVVWVQGCTQECPGCFNPEFQQPNGGEVLSIDEIVRRILAVTEAEGLTVSGGEPLDQAAGVAIIAAQVQAAGRSVVVFTGYAYPDLLDAEDPDISDLLAHVDLLVAGPYDEKQPCTDHALLSSSNQQLIHLTKRYRQYDFSSKGRRTEYRIRPDGKTEVSGFPPTQPN